jgi:hypothetical protein
MVFPSRQSVPVGRKSVGEVIRQGLIQPARPDEVLGSTAGLFEDRVAIGHGPQERRNDHEINDLRGLASVEVRRRSRVVHFQSPLLSDNRSVGASDRRVTPPSSSAGRNVRLTGGSDAVR